MARFYSYAEVASDSSAEVGVSADGAAPPRTGRPLREYVEDGEWEFRMPLAEDLRTQLREVAALSGDHRLARLADTTEIPISLEHLRGLDLDTRIVCGVGVEYTEEEARTLQLPNARPPRAAGVSKPRS